MSPTETPLPRSEGSPEIQPGKPIESVGAPKLPEQPQPDARDQREQLSKKVDARIAVDPAASAKKPPESAQAPSAPGQADKPKSGVMEFFSNLITPSVFLGAVSMRFREKGFSGVADFIDQFLGVDTRLLSDALSGQSLVLKGWFIPVWNLVSVYNQVKALRRDALTKDQFYREVAENLKGKLGGGAQVPFEAVLASAQDLLKKAQKPEAPAPAPANQPETKPSPSKE